MEPTDLISSLTVKCKTGSDSCLAQLVKISDQASKIEQFSRKLSEFDLKLNGFKPRSGHLHLTNSTTTSTSTTTTTATSTRLTTISTASPSRSTTGPESIRSSLPNFISHLTDRELETQHETDLTKKNKIYFCDYENENFGDKNINIKSDGDSDQQSNIETNSKINRRRKCLRDQIYRESNHAKNSGDDEPSLTSESIKRLTLLPRKECDPPAIAYDCVDYVNSLEDSPQPRVSRFKSNRFSKEANSTSTCNLKPPKSTRSYSRLNSLPCNKNSDSNDFNDETIFKPNPRNCLRAFSIPNGLNSDLTTSPSHRSNSISNSRESLDHGLNSGETSSHRIVGSLLDSPKWSIIKEKFEKSSNNNDSNNGNSSENKDKTEIVTYSSPQLRRKTYPTSTSNLTPSLSLSNLTLLSANNCGKARSISLTPSFSSSSSSSTATMDKKMFPLQSTNNETNKCNNRYSTSSLKSNSSSSSTSSYSSSSHSTSSTLTNGSYTDRPNSFSTDRLTSTTATSLSPLSSSYSLENHGNYPIERMCSSGKVHLEQSVRMKSNSRIAKIASKFDSGVNQSGSTTSLNSGTFNESKACKSKSDLREFNKMITTSSSTSSSTTSLFTVVKQSSECNFSEQSEKCKKSKFTSNNSISSPSSSSLSSLTDVKSIRNENEEEKIVSVKETILRLECIKASTVDSIHQSGAKINRSISDQQSTKPVISSRRKTLPGATFLHNGSLSAVNINENNDNQNTLSLSSDSNHALPSNLLKDSGKSDKVPIPAPRKISNNQDCYMTKGTPSFLWSNNNHNFNRLAGTSCTLPSSTANVKERKDNLPNESNQCGKESNNRESTIGIDEPIYEPVSYSTTPAVNISNLNSSVNRSLPSNNLSAINRDNRTIIHDYDDNLSLASENSSLTYSDSGSYSSGVHEASTLSSSTSSSNRSNSVIPSNHSILPPPLPPRWPEASKQGNSNTFTTTANIFNPISTNCGLSLTALDTYLSNQWDNKDDCYGADHIYDSIYYNNLSDELTLDKSEALSKLLKELENMSPNGDRNAKEDTNSTNSSGASMSRTPSTLSCSSVSRNGSNASESRDKSSDEFSSGIVTLKSCESSSSLESIRNTSCSSSQVPPKITPRTTIKSSQESNSGGYANFPSIMENKILLSGSLMDSILESSSPSLRETIQREMKRSEYHSRLHQSETLMKNSSFLHSNRLSLVSKKSSDYVEAINPADQKKPNINDLYREGLIHPESRYETHEYEGYMEFKETRGFFSSTAEQPLYQLYDEQVKHNRILWASGLGDDSQEEADPLDAIYAELDGVSKCACSSCELDDGSTPTDSVTSSIVSTTSATPHISAIDLVGKNGNRQLWCEVPQVKEAGVAAKLTPKERKHQEAMFEVITSEASYLKSLDILVNHFMKSDEFSNPEILNSHDRSDLFSNIESVFEITRRLMKDLDDRWQTNVVISDVCDILLRYATSEFEDYVKYLRFCKKQEKTLKTLQKQPKFAASLKQLETNPKCHGLALTSFLLLPMQRITRYPLLVEAILNHRAPTETDKYEMCQKTLAALYTVVNDCNEEAKKTERLQELIDLDSILNFDKVKYFPLISESRYLMKKDEVVRLKQTSSSIIPARGRNPLWKKSPLHLYLFNDLLLIASKKSEIYYSVNDYCERNCLTVRSMDVPGEEITPPIGMKSSLENLIQLTFLKNHARRTSEYYIAFPTETDKIRFIEAIEPPKSDKPNEKIYEEWDCPQVICERQYTAQQPDELSLEKSDVVNVFRKTNDWYEGERIRDGARGWFPASCTQEIVNKHVRSRNLKLRHRLMTLTDKHILDMQKRNPNESIEKEKESSFLKEMYII
uniref:DH domain-containing protein n=1 Tax=Tetranychus urticae TaxID=32264 RepID=T1KQ37_TETUR